MCLSNLKYSLKKCHNQFGKVFQPPLPLGNIQNNVCFFLPPWSFSVTYVSQAIEEQYLKTLKRLIVGCQCPPWGRDGRTDSVQLYIHQMKMCHLSSSW